MSQLKAQLIEDMKTAMKARDQVKLGVVRYILSEVKNVEIDNGEQNDEGVQKVIAREVKKMQEAIADFKKGGREDLVAEETAKVALMQAYLPQQMSDEELSSIVKSVVEELAGEKNFGIVMKKVMEKVGGQADGKRVSEMVKTLL